MENMRRVALCSGVLGVLGVAFMAPAAGAAEATPVVVLRVEGAIDRPLLGYLDDRLAQAERDGAIVVLQLDTSGTLGQHGQCSSNRQHRSNERGTRRDYYVTSHDSLLS